MSRRPSAYVVGLTEARYRHPGAGRYPRFAEFANAPFLRTIAGWRFFSNPLLNRIDMRLLGRWSRSVDPNYPYSLGLLLQESSTFLAMLRRPGASFHFVKGEVDVHHLPRWRRRTNARILVTFHDDPAFLEHQDLAVDLLREADFFRDLDGVMALCRTQQDFFARFMDPRRVFLLPHGVDTKRFVPADRRSREPVVVSVGSYCRDHVAFEGAVRRVWEEDPTVRFLIIGTGTRPGESPMSFRDDPRVDYLDGISDDALVASYHRASVAVVSVWAATANNALLEAMACGLPVVASDLGGLPEYLGPEAGRLVAPYDPEALARGILEALRDHDASDRMGAAGRRRAVENFDYHVVGALARDAYDAVRRWPQAPADPTD